MDAFIDLSKNYSFFTIPAALGMAFVPKFYLFTVGSRYYDVAYPRNFQESVKKDDELDKTVKNRLLRCEAAHANSMETLPVFIGAVLAAHVAGVPVRTTNLLSIGYVASRSLYCLAYIWLQDNRKLAPVRSLVWNAGVVCWLTLFIKAGYRVLEASS